MTTGSLTRAARLERGRPLPPFGDMPLDTWVLGETLDALQHRVLGEVGLTLGEAPDGPHLVVGDDTWLTPGLLRRFLDACPPDGGQLALSGPFVDFTAPLQDLPGQGTRRYPLAVVPRAGVSLHDLPPIEVDLDATEYEPDWGHPAMAHAQQGPIPVTDAMIHTLDHWSHVLRVNLLALIATAEGERRAFEASPWWRKVATGAGLVMRARSIDKWKLAAAVGPRGANCNVHPTATVEACVLGNDVEIGPHAVVRASWLGDGVKVAEHARVNLTVAGDKAVLGRDVMANLCCLMPGAMLSAGFGFQACLLGRDSFVAMGATCYDLSFGGPVKTTHRGQRVSSGSHFLGSAIGHRAKLGPHVILGYGEAVPNEAFIVCDPSRVARRIPETLPEGPVSWDGSQFVTVGRPKQ